jgi:MFS family permease
MPRWLGLRLSLMFFLDVGATAAYFPLLSIHLSQTLGFSPAQIGVVFAMGPLAALVAPLLIGGLTDRHLPAERAAVLVNLARAIALLVVSRATTFPEVVAAMFLLGFVSAPSTVVDFTIAFFHLRDDPGAIGRTRVFGTISWIVMLWVSSAYFRRFDGVEAQLARTHDLFVFAAAIAFASALHALTLPHTPPARAPSTPLALVGALRLLRRPDFRALIVAGALASICMQFHFVLHTIFYTDPVTGLGLDLSATGFASSVAQFLEVAVLPLLGAMLARLGMRRILTIGMLAWPLRFLAYCVGGPAAFVIGAQSLHGINVVFGQIASQVAVDRLAPDEVRASSQALLQSGSTGAGNLAGQLLCGALLELFALPNGGYLWPAVFAVPLVLGLIACLVVNRGLGSPNRARTEGGI